MSVRFHCFVLAKNSCSPESTMQGYKSLSTCISDSRKFAQAVQAAGLCEGARKVLENGSARDMDALAADIGMLTTAKVRTNILIFCATPGFEENGVMFLRSSDSVGHHTDFPFQRILQKSRNKATLLAFIATCCVQRTMNMPMLSAQGRY